MERCAPGASAVHFCCWSKRYRHIPPTPRIPSPKGGCTHANDPHPPPLAGGGLFTPLEGGRPPGERQHRQPAGDLARLPKPRVPGPLDPHPGLHRRRPHRHRRQPPCLSVPHPGCRTGEGQLRPLQDPLPRFSQLRRPGVLSGGVFSQTPDPLHRPGQSQGGQLLTPRRGAVGTGDPHQRDPERSVCRQDLRRRAPHAGHEAAAGGVHRVLCPVWLRQGPGEQTCAGARPGGGAGRAASVSMVRPGAGAGGHRPKAQRSPRPQPHGL